MTVGERLRIARKERKFSQEQLAKTIRTSRGVITNIELDKINEIQPLFIDAICKALGINKEWLLHGVGEMDSLPEKNPIIVKATKLLGEKDPLFEAFIETYSKLDKTSREILISFGKDFLNNLK